VSAAVNEDYVALRRRKNEANLRYEARLRGEPVAYLHEPWKAAEILALTDLYSRGLLNRDGQLKALAARLGRSFGAVATKAHQLGLTGPRDASRAQPDSTCRAVSLTREREKATGAAGGKGRGHGGRRADLGDRYFRSAWEANYARYLNFAKIAWEYEAKTFRFERITRGTMSYTPDFWLPELGAYHEVKGWMDPKSKTQLDRMVRYFPDVKVVVIGRDWFGAARRQGLPSIVPGWETLR